MIAIFKYTFFLFLLPLGLSVKFQDKRACEVYNKNLAVIKARLNIDEHQNLGKVEASINFFERVTGIVSHSDGDYFGRYSPTKEDYSTWLNWYKKNKKRLYWDDKEKVVKVR